MAIIPEPTPNPNAMKFTVGRPVGGPTTFEAGQDVDDDFARALLDLDGVSRVFLTADFVTLTKDADAEWGDITPAAVGIIEAHFS